MMTTHARRTVAAICAVMTTMVPAVGSAQTSNGADAGIAPIPLSGSPRVERTVVPEAPGLKIREWRWSESESSTLVASLVQAGPSVRPPQTRQRQRHSRQYRDVQRVLAAFALGTVGFLAGSMVGLLAPVDYRISGSIGAAGGATAGLLLVR